MTRDEDSLPETLRLGDTLPDQRPRDPGLEVTAAHQVETALGAYELGAVIARGGMGEILVAHDRRIGRDVALKRMLADEPSDEMVARFVREAKVQARLEHPAIVPVHDLGQDAQGRPYFTMKRLTGTTLAEQLARRAPTQPLLHAFVDVCHAIELAHSRGVIHRDLKPSNIMLGDYGEVHVLDWGVARVLGESELAADEELTGIGQLLGTPGYMAPEQIDNAPGVERPADVYALGSMLFEILTGGVALHPRGTQQSLQSTLTGGSDPSPARRAPDRAIAPELDALCIAALALDPRLRPSAHDVASAVQAYLDGDRDLARRRTMAHDWLMLAHSANVEERRSDAMRAASRALALDPESSGAAQLVTRLMLEPPREPPPGLDAELRAADAEAVRRHATSSLYGYAGLLAFIPIAIYAGVRSWFVFGAIAVLDIALVACTLAFRRYPHRGTASLIGYLALVIALMPLIERVFGPLVVVPAYACLIAWAALMYPEFTRRPWLVIAPVLAVSIIPPVLEARGLLPATWSIANGVIAATPDAIAIGGTRTVVLVFGASLAAIVIASLHGATLARANLDAQRRLVSQTWHLRQLLPADG